ncbi:glycosyltransferase family 2 protein [Hufsiella ginkgonis]|uniref:Glycosyltransferase n=1 Tax=Hufsiella ginkgonis TaxID=2695274 RepID=A0A7K1Y430_9SPHI|nr:glycosyltransferase [Hufsiella ginkgonis]MXV17456.1 glycosyltransferase [Hufsiella ginkgonis]
MPKVSIIMPAYNSARYLRDAIQSVLGQSYRDWELLVINDGSTDDTRAVAESYAAADERIKLVNQPNQGQGNARTNGFGIATGEWIAFLDSDDLWDPGKLEKQLALARKFPHIDFIYTDGWKFSGDHITSNNPYTTITGEFSAGEMYKHQYRENFIANLSVLVKRTIVGRVGAQCDDYCEDWDYWLRAALAGATFYGMPDRLFYYRRHPEGSSANSVRIAVCKVKILAKNYVPGKLTAKETRRAFIPVLNDLFPTLLRTGRKEEAFQLVDLIAPILPGHAKWYRLLVSLAGKVTLPLFVRGNRIYKKFGRTFGSKRRVVN